MAKSASAPPRGKRGRNITWHPVDEAAGGSEKRNRILQAAIAIFARDGYFPAHISDIAARADVADGTVYLYFKNKEQILMAVIDSAFIPFMEAARGDFSQLDPRERLHRLAVLHLETLGKNRELAMVFQTQLRQSSKFLDEFSQRHLVEYFNLIREIVRDGQANGQFRAEVSDKIAANCFFGSLDAMVTSWLMSARDYNLANAAEALVDVIVRGMETRH